MDQSSRLLTGWLGVRVPPSALQPRLRSSMDQSSRLLTGWFRVRVSAGALDLGLAEWLGAGLPNLLRGFDSRIPVRFPTRSCFSQEAGASVAGGWSLKSAEWVRFPPPRYRGRLKGRCRPLTPAMKVRALPPVPGFSTARAVHSAVAQWQSRRLLTARLQVRSLPAEQGFFDVPVR